MNFDEIKTFIAVSELGNISKASDHLFVSQSTVSARLQSLEKDLGVKLLQRSKGQRRISLTDQGRDIKEILLQQLELYEQAKRMITYSHNTFLRIASVDIINNQTFLPFYEKIINQMENIHLSISTFHSKEIHQLVANRKADIGFVFSQTAYPNIISKPIYRELFYLVCHKESHYYDQIHPNQLNACEEIYLKWNDDFELWHDQFWDRNQAFLTVNTGSMLEHYILQSKKWAIAPRSVVDKLTEHDEICSFQLSETPPPQICYRLIHQSQNDNSQKVLSWIDDELEVFIESNDRICTFKEWMLNSARLNP